jgi:hypothetical protein
MPQAIRWTLILPAAIAAWYLALFVGIGLYQGAEMLCPASEVVSGHCFTPWFRAASEGLIAFGAALAAIFVMLACTLLAPTHKRQVAIVTFSVGASVAIYMGVGASAYLAMASAVVSGGVVLMILLQRLPPFSRPNKSLERTREG